MTKSKTINKKFTNNKRLRSLKMRKRIYKGGEDKQLLPPVPPILTNTSENKEEEVFKDTSKDDEKEVSDILSDTSQDNQQLENVKTQLSLPETQPTSYENNKPVEENNLLEPKLVLTIPENSLLKDALNTFQYKFNLETSKPMYKDKTIDGITLIEYAHKFVNDLVNCVNEKNMNNCKSYEIADVFDEKFSQIGIFEELSPLFNQLVSDAKNTIPSTKTYTHDTYGMEGQEQENNTFTNPNGGSRKKKNKKSKKQQKKQKKNRKSKKQSKRNRKH
jgi:hypothetical protein